ncbi:hypothetical protein HWI79_1288 [Cryptosporidium felis]|nr:hypothetical protein HWI79_1288 [Cryptosporidium felis]
MSDIRDFCDIAILKASYGINIGQTIYVRVSFLNLLSTKTSVFFFVLEFQWIIGPESCDLGEEDNLQEEVVWWPATVLMTETEERDPKGRRLFQLKYEEREGFNSDSTKVIFESGERVVHPSYNGISLKFCKTKEEAEKFKEIEDTHESEHPENENTVTLQEILEGDLLNFSGSEESESGESGGNLVNIFNSLPHEKKINLAQGYREFADKFIEFLKKKMSNEQDKNTITIEDVRDFVAFLGLDKEQSENECNGRSNNTDSSSGWR